MTFIMVTHSQQEAMSLADKVIVMSDAVIQQIGTSREVHENPRTKFVAEFIGNNNLFQGRIQSRSGSIVFVETLGQLLYVKVPPDIRHVPIGKNVWFSVRADLMNTGEKDDMANRIEGKYIASEFWARWKPTSSRSRLDNMFMSSSIATPRTTFTRSASAKSCAGMPSRGSCSKSPARPRTSTREGRRAMTSAQWSSQDG